MKYIKELDALRGLAILSVVVSHWFPKDSLLYNIADRINAPNIFFTISGFLITKILLTERENAKKLQYSRLQVFKNFMIKRALRIFPAYYLLLLLVYLPHKIEPVQYWPYLTFTANFHIYASKTWGPISHLWTMAVEEQFYLIWPWLILFMNKKLLPYGMLSFLLAGLISHYALPANEFSQVLTITCFDALALGGLLAWVVTTHTNRLPELYKILCMLAPISLLIFVINNLNDVGFYHIFNRTLTAVMVLWLITYFLTRNSQAPPLLLFESRLLRTIGRMSFGIYLYHTVLPFYSFGLFSHINRLLPLTIQKNVYFYMAEDFMLLVCVSWLSWKLLELPFLNLKRYINKPETPIIVPAGGAI